MHSGLEFHETHLQLRQFEVGAPEGVLPVEQQPLVADVLRTLRRS